MPGQIFHILSWHFLHKSSLLQSCHHPHQPGIRIGCELHIIHSTILHLYYMHHPAILSAFGLLCGCNSRPLRTLFLGGYIVSVGYAVAHPRLNTVGILPSGSRPSDVHFHDGIIAVDVKELSRSFRWHYRSHRCDDMRSM